MCDMPLLCFVMYNLKPDQVEAESHQKARKTRVN